MQISNDYGLENIYSISALNSNRTDTAKSETSIAPMDTVSISEEAMEAYKESKVNSDDTNDIYAQFRKKFNSYRGNGIFEQSEVNDTYAVTEAGEEAQGAPSGGGGGSSEGSTSEEIQEKIKTLTSQLQSIMSSNLPEGEKNAKAAQLQAQISELQAQLNSAG